VIHVQNETLEYNSIIIITSAGAVSNSDKQELLLQVCRTIILFIQKEICIKRI